MNKLTIIAALALAANSTVTYTAAEYPCYNYNETAKAYEKGSDSYTVTPLTTTASKTDTAKVVYTDATTVTLDSSSTLEADCDLVFHSGFAI